MNDIAQVLKNGAEYIFIAGISYPVFLVSLNRLSVLFSDKINSQENLDKIIDQEVNKLGIKKVRGIFVNNSIGSAKKIDEQAKEEYEYELQIGGGLAKRSVVRHELYHIYRGHCEINVKNNFAGLLEYLVRETQASAYGCFGLKI